MARGIAGTGGDEATDRLLGGEQFFFYAAAAVGRSVRRRRESAPVAIADVFTQLIGAGFGRNHRDIADQFTWRQIERYFGLIQTQRRHARADLIEAVAAGFGAKDLPKLLRQLRKDQP